MQTFPREFLDLDDRDRFASDWCQRLITAKESKSYFRGNPLKSTKAFAGRIGFEVAIAYLECVDDDAHVVAPTRTQISTVKDSARGLERHVSEFPWLVAEARASSFQATLRLLRESPSRVEPRGPGRLAYVHRQRFVKIAAENLSFLDPEIHVGLLTVAASLAWEDITDRQVRLILTPEVRGAIATTVKSIKAMSAEADAETLDALAKARRITRGAPAKRQDLRTDGDKLLEAIAILRSLDNEWASAELIERVSEIANDHGIEIPASEYGGNTPEFASISSGNN